MDVAQRVLPIVDDASRPFWEAGRDGVLRFPGCNACGALLHPPVPVCRYCRSEDLATRDVAPTGVVVGITVNHQQWDARYAPPFVIATVAIDADPRVRLITNVVDLEPEDARVGMRHVGSSWVDNANSLKVPPHTLVDLMFRVDLAQWSASFRGANLRLGVNNLFDKAYVASCYSPQYCYWGDARSATATLTYEW